MAKLGEMLIREKLITEEQLQEAIALQKKKKTFLGEALVEIGAINEKTLLNALVRQTGSSTVELGELKLDPATGRLLPWAVARKYGCVVFKAEGELLSLAMTDPTNQLAVDDIQFRSKK